MDADFVQLIIQKINDEAKEVTSPGRSMGIGMENLALQSEKAKLLIFDKITVTAQPERE